MRFETRTKWPQSRGLENKGGEIAEIDLSRESAVHRSAAEPRDSLGFQALPGERREFYGARLAEAETVTATRHATVDAALYSRIISYIPSNLPPLLAVRSGFPERLVRIP